MTLRDNLSSKLEGLTPVRRELRALREAQERLREELAAQQERTEEADRKHREEVQRLEGDRDKHRDERDELAEQLKSLQGSQAYRVGHAIVRVATFPLAAARAILSLAKRVVRGLARRVILPTGRVIARLARAVWRAVRGAGRVLARSGRAVKARLSKQAAQSAGPAQPAAPPADESRVISVPEGNQFLGPLTDGHATTMFLLWGLSEEEIDSLVDEVARLQMMQWDFKPLFVTDSDHWGPFQDHSYWFEYVPPAEDWISHNSGGDWSQFVSERVDSIVEMYAPNRIVVYEDSAKRGALRHGVLNGVISAGEPVVEVTTTGKLQPPQGNGDRLRAAAGHSQLAQRLRGVDRAQPVRVAPPPDREQRQRPHQVRRLRRAKRALKLARPRPQQARVDLGPQRALSQAVPVALEGHPRRRSLRLSPPSADRVVGRGQRADAGVGELEDSPVERAVELCPGLDLEGRASDPVIAERRQHRGA